MAREVAVASDAAEMVDAAVDAEDRRESSLMDGTFFGNWSISAGFRGPRRRRGSRSRRLVADDVEPKEFVGRSIPRCGSARRLVTAALEPALPSFKFSMPVLTSVVLSRWLLPLLPLTLPLPLSSPLPVPLLALCDLPLFHQFTPPPSAGSLRPSLNALLNSFTMYDRLPPDRDRRRLSSFGLVDETAEAVAFEVSRALWHCVP
mmetsp:Transcript_6374/g.18749  ORF Transcript_6374/g.18749 Transcript_6374/m.18749 type:complete len:204 (-) Transcript_6374:1487-2098(-)